jgi:hypothetical protein
MFLPQRIKQSRFLSDREWIPIMNEAHNHYGSGKTEVVAKVWYLSCVMQYPLYGCTMFPSLYRGYWSHGKIFPLKEYNSSIQTSNYIYLLAQNLN